MGKVRVLALRTPPSALLLVLTLLILFLLATAASCGGSADLPEKPELAPINGIESLPPPSSLRLTTYVPAQLLRNGCDYMWGPDFPQQNASAVDLNCELKPSWTPSDPAFAGLAYACYGFDMTDYDRPGMITFTWAEQGDPADLWIGLSDFTRDCWSWHSISGGNTLEVSLQNFVDPASKLMLVLPLVTGTAPWSLNLIQLGDLASVSGIVLDEYGTPLENVEVVLHGEQDYPARTNTQGQWRIESVPFGEYAVSAYLIRWAFTPPVHQLTVEKPDHDVEQFTGAPVLPLYLATGSVQDSEGGGMLLVELQVRMQSSPYGSISTWTDTGGIWTCDLPDGEYIVTPRKPGWAFTPESRQFSIAGGDTVVDPFTGNQLPGYLLDGYVFQSDGETPLPDVLVYIINTDLYLYFYPMTDDDGYWSVPSAPDGNYYLEPGLYGWAFEPAVLYITVAGGDLRVPPFTGVELSQYSVDGYVFLDDGTTPLPNVDMELSGYWGPYHAVTDSNGHYEFADVMEGEYNLLPIKFGYDFNPAQVAITVDADITVDPILATKLPTFQMDGHVYLPDGVTGIEGVQVTASEYEQSGAFGVTTNAAGYWQIPDAPVGEYYVAASKDGFTIEPDFQVVMVEDSDVTVGDFIGTPLPTYMMSGYVYETDGSTPIPGVTISLYGWICSYETTTNASGYWVVGEVVQDYYMVMPTLVPWQFTPPYREIVLSGGNVVVDPFLGELP